MKWIYAKYGLTISLLVITTQVIANQQPKNNWFVAIGAGENYPDLHGNTGVDNGSGFPPPYDRDLYSFTNDDNQTALVLSGGYRWQRDSYWFPAYSLGLLYEHFFESNITGTVTQYSLPQYTNYLYSWDNSADLVLASAKLNIMQYQRISPYVNLGIGGAFNKTSSFHETPLPGVTPRVSPGFGGSTSSQFAYNAGIGIDVSICPQVMVSVGYTYQNLGDFGSGRGQGSWSGESLNLGSYHSDALVVTLNYLFDFTAFAKDK